MKRQKKTKKRWKAKHNNHLQDQVYPGHNLSKTGRICFWPIAWLVGEYFLLDFRVYPFLTPNRSGIPVVLGDLPLTVALGNKSSKTEYCIHTIPGTYNIHVISIISIG